MAKDWSAKVTASSNALDLEKGVFTLKDPHKIALSLRLSAVSSTRRKGTARQSAMSMLNFYINRAGKNLDDEQKIILYLARQELKEMSYEPVHNAGSGKTIT